MNNKERRKVGNKISYITIIANVLLSFIKFIAGIIGKSNAMLADSIHSLSDVLTTIGVIIGLKFSSKPADKEHPYGHEKLESITSKLLAVVLCLTGIFIGYKAINTIIKGSYNIPGKIAVYAAIISIVVKEWMYRYTIKGAKLINSGSLEADAWHHRSDALSSIGSLVGILGARVKLPILDPIASLVICVLIIKMSFDIYKKAILGLIDRAADDEMIELIKKEIMSIQKVEHIDDLKTRIHGNSIYVDVEISVCEDLSFPKAHNISELVHKNIEKLDSRIIHCMVHVNPCKKIC